ncbi:D-tagatose-bisphosphate aldolase, class II, non-catalytic subunit [Meridianimarinicoccus sp. RP-17]|uniref:D-tagatose-bisphosphate aldolase, class II, non-catalytic subunit n=1 Tax=Meridianimarinicoccus zhengii TaxID=2056810 RepID=UPI000DABD06C|nr:D-tagatose-bisphosphate aldolase, class II, non-catalytic subunit [Phycocomes zhengii]
MTHPLLGIPADQQVGRTRGITSVCSAHPLVIEAALALGRDRDRPVLIEATCNQVNQDGGYTGMTPAAFRDFVEAIAARVGYDPARIILGGDHLGPNPWKHLAADAAMAKAEAMIAAYAAAGFTKLHLDTSMGCAGEPVALPDETTASRAARLVAVAETLAAGPLRPVYVIGTEVPVPGGATGGLDHMEVTAPDAPMRTHAVHREAFDALGLRDAFGRVIALVVQPGVEFGHDGVIQFDPARAANLSAALGTLPGIVFEAHSTDYQTGPALTALVQNGFAILKVGPWLTFALREALYGLDAVADVLDGHPPKGRLMAAMEAAMQADPAHWRSHYTGSDREQWLLRHFSLSDRIRYYWPSGTAQAAVGELLARLGDTPVPAPLAAQFLPAASVTEALPAHELIVQAVAGVLDIYDTACAPPR